MKDNFKLYSSIVSETKKRYFALLCVTKVNQNGVDCKRSIRHLATHVLNTHETQFSTFFQCHHQNKGNILLSICRNPTAALYTRNANCYERRSVLLYYYGRRECSLTGEEEEGGNFADKYTWSLGAVNKKLKVIIYIYYT